MAEDALVRLRAICLALPQATERVTWDHPNFRVGEKIFTLVSLDAPISFCCKAPPGAQATLIGADPDRFYIPAYTGPKGWVGMRLADDPDWDEVTFLVRRSYKMTAPKRLAMQVE
jgi:hypothetical protein